MLRTFITLLILSSCFSACNKFDLDGQYQFDYNFMVGDHTIDLHQEVRINGINVIFEELKYYVSEFQWLDVDGTNWDKRGRPHLCSPNRTTGIDGPTAIENIRNVEFIFGLDSISAFQEGHRPWDDTNEGMYYDDDYGNHFLKFEVWIDTDGDDSVDAMRYYALGSKDFARAFEFDVTFSKKRDRVNLVLDLSRLFRNVDMLESIDVAKGLNMEAANKMIDNLEKSLKME